MNNVEEEVVKKLCEFSPDIVLIDEDLGSRNSGESIAKKIPASGVILIGLSSAFHQDYCHEVFRLKNDLLSCRVQKRRWSN